MGARKGPFFVCLVGLWDGGQAFARMAPGPPCGAVARGPHLR